MIGLTLDGAHWLDAWLKAHLGRLYNGVLGLGLGLGLSAAITSLQKELGEGAGVWKVAGLIVFQLLLLLNQLAQLREFRDDIRRRRQARREARRTTPVKRD